MPSFSNFLFSSLLLFAAMVLAPTACAAPVTLTDGQLDAFRGGFFRLTELQLTPAERAAREAQLNARLAANPRPLGTPAPTVTIRHVYTISFF